MRWDLFWTHKSVLDAGGLQVGFGMFSLGHLLWFLLMAAGIAAFAVLYLHGAACRRDNMRKALALFIILFEIFKQCTMALTGAPIERNLPLHVCSFAEYAMLADALWPEERFFPQVFLYLFLPSAVMALAFPTVTAYPAVSFYAIHQFVLHACMAAYIIARFAAGEFSPRYAGIWTSLLKLLPVGLLIYWLDVALDKNYMFLTNPVGNPVLEMLWSVSGGRGGVPYLGALVLFILVIEHITAPILWLLAPARRQRRPEPAH